MQTPWQAQRSLDCGVVDEHAADSNDTKSPRLQTAL
jgi:hypothetical protein